MAASITPGEAGLEMDPVDLVVASAKESYRNKLLGGPIVPMIFDQPGTVTETPQSETPQSETQGEI